VSTAAEQSVVDAAVLAGRLTTVRAAIEEQSIRVAELHERFESELRRVQVFRAPSGRHSAGENHDREPPQASY